jgi:hypothetical protein
MPTATRAHAIGLPFFHHASKGGAVVSLISVSERRPARHDAPRCCLKWRGTRSRVGVRTGRSACSTPPRTRPAPTRRTRAGRHGRRRPGAPARLAEWVLPGHALRGLAGDGVLRRVQDLAAPPPPLDGRFEAALLGALLFPTRISFTAWWFRSSGLSEMTIAGRSKRASASRSGSARRVPSPYGRCLLSLRFA